jgi:hypothetical protein
MLEHRDVVTIETSKAMKIRGNWSSGYEIIVSGKGLTVVDIVGKYITSVKSTTLPDVQESWNFTANQKRMISIAFANPDLQKALSGMSDGEDYYVSAIRDHGMGDLGYVVVSHSTKPSPIFMTTINQTSGAILPNGTYPLG